MLWTRWRRMCIGKGLTGSEHILMDQRHTTGSFLVVVWFSNLSQKLPKIFVKLADNRTWKNLDPQKNLVGYIDGLYLNVTWVMLELKKPEDNDRRKRWGLLVALQTLKIWVDNKVSMNHQWEVMEINAKIPVQYIAGMVPLNFICWDHIGNKVIISGSFISRRV